MGKDARNKARIFEKAFCAGRDAAGAYLEDAAAAVRLLNSKVEAARLEAYASEIRAIEPPDHKKGSP